MSKHKEEHHQLNKALQKVVSEKQQEMCGRFYKLSPKYIPYIRLPYKRTEVPELTHDDALRLLKKLHQGDLIVCVSFIVHAY